MDLIVSKQGIKNKKEKELENMKTKMKLNVCASLVILSFWISSALAQTSPSQEYSGKVGYGVEFKRYNFIYNDFDVMVGTAVLQSSIVVNSWGQDKIDLLFKIKAGYRGCMGALLNYVGYGTASNTYDLYLKTSGSTPTPADSKAVGSLILAPSKAFLKFTGDFSVVTKNYAGPCTFSLPAAGLIELKLSKE